MDRDIRFIDSDYNRLFSIPDGGKISLTYPDRENVILTCKYIDDYHFPPAWKHGISASLQKSWSIAT